MKENNLSRVSNTPSNKEVELLSLLKRLEIFDIQTDESQPYSLKTESGSEFVRNVLTRSLSNCYENIRRVESSNDEMFRSIAHAQAQLCLKSGGVVLSKDEVKHPFFAHEGYATDLYGYWSSRGPLYYIFSDTFMEREECIDKMINEYMLLKEHIGILSDITSTQTQKVAYLDYLKNFFLIVYHAYTYPERFGIELNKEASTLKGILRKASEEFTRMYYRVLLGKTVDFTSTRDEFECVELQWDMLVNYFKNSNDFESGWFKYSELDDPIIILKAAYSFLNEDSDVDVIIGIESGGTELCFVTKLLYRLIGNVDFVDTELVALSRYTLQKSSLYKGKTTPSEIIDSQISRLSLANKRVLIVDDNSNTGESAQLVFNALQKISAHSVRIRVAEFDMHRSMFKHLNWNKKPDYIAHPDLFLCSVGVTPITQGLDEFLAFRQRRKIVRLNILQNYFKTKQKVSRSKIKKKQATAPRIKICNVHNFDDLATCWNEGVQWFGVHCLYDDEKYRQKVLTLPRAHQLEYKLNMDFRVGEATGLPLAEVTSLREMFTSIQESDIKPNVVFLIDGNNTTTLPALFKHIVPESYKQSLYIQLQNIYSPNITNEIYNQAKGLYKHGIGLIQTFGSSEDIGLLEAANDDPLINYILIDYQQEGGTGKTIEASVLRSIVEKTKKQFFVAGGIKPSNVRNLLSILGDMATNFSIDLESGVEFSNSAEKFYIGKANECIILRKSPKLVNSMVLEWTKTVELLKVASEYESLELEGSTFKNSLNESWLRSKDRHGFFAVKPTIEDHARNTHGLEPTADTVSDMTDGLLKYEHLPAYYRRSDHLSQEYTRNRQIPWIIKSSPVFLRKVNDCVKKNKIAFYIWTAGEDPSANTTEYLQTNEQRLKFVNSGLSDYMESIGLKENKDYKFLASPNKLMVLENELKKISLKKTVIVLDDKVSNLDAAESILSVLGFIEYRTFLLNSREINDVRAVRAAEDTLAYFKDKKDVVIFCDMDGVLIHEEFRNEHQPKSLYLTMSAATDFKSAVSLYGQRQSPLKVNYSKLSIDTTHYNKYALILTSADPTSIPINDIFNQLRDADIQRIPQVATKAQVILSETDTNQYVNDSYFRNLIRNGELIEYSYNPDGYTGTTFDMLAEIVQHNTNGVILLDMNTAHLMAKLLQTAGIKSRTIFVHDNKRSDKENKNEELGAFDYVISSKSKTVASTLRNIIESNKE